MFRPLPALFLFLPVIVSPVFGQNYAEDTGFNKLAAELGASMLTGNGVGVTQVESGGAAVTYLPQAGTGTFAGTGYFAGKSFTAKTGTTGASSHAFDVGMHFYGSNTNSALFRASMAPGIVNIDGYDANSWDDVFLAPLPSRLAPAAEIRFVQNHSWVYEAEWSPGSAPTLVDWVRRQDFSINRENYVAIVGLNNGSTTAIPDLMASAYNVLSVGLSNGEHSRGLTTADMDGPGRRKPELVAPLDATSFSTAYVSSAAAILRQKANLINTNNARNSKTLKAVLLAGATKTKFPAWARTTTDPIDFVYGAGEMNVYNSYHILNGGEQPAAGNVASPPGTSVFLAHRAWDVAALSGASATNTNDYRLQIPAGSYGVELSAFVVWHRTLSDPPTSGFTLNPDTLVNYDLALYLDPAAGGSPVLMDFSVSTIYPYEHVYVKNLPAGNYRLRVSRATGASMEYSIAWRLSTAPHSPSVSMQTAGLAQSFQFTGLLTGQAYRFQSSPDLAAWTDLESFTATEPSRTRVGVTPANRRLLYRLLPVLR